MPENLQPETMSTWMRDVERRLRGVELNPKFPIQQYGAVVPPNTLATFNNAAWTPVWEFRLGYVFADAVSVRVVVTTTPGTTTEIRLRDNTYSNTTSVVSIPPNTSEQCAFDWIVPNLFIFMRTTGPIIYVEARRTGGTDDTYVYIPQVALQAQSTVIGATSDGNARTV
jgi:hypothetical protein